MDLAELKLKMNDSCDLYYASKPFRGGLNKMLKIIAQGGPDLTKLQTAITQADADCAALKTKIDALADMSISDNFKTDENAKMQKYIDGKMPGLAGDSQKLDAAVIIQQAMR